MRWLFLSESDADFWSSRRTQIADSHAARAWLAAQPRPVPEVGMRVEATFHSGAVVTGVVSVVNDNPTEWYVEIGGIGGFFRSPNGGTATRRIDSWHEVTA